MKLQNYFRRADHTPGGQNDRICSCHFKDGVKDGDPAYFAWNEGKTMDFSDPELRKRKRKKLTSEEEPLSPEVAEDIECEDPEKMMIQHNYSASCTPSCAQEMQHLSAEIQHLEKELAELRVKCNKQRPMSIDDIQGNEEKMLLYTSVQYDIFEILVRISSIIVTGLHQWI